MVGKGSIVVVGGGVSGVQSALDLADNGYKVYLVDHRPTPGGRVGRMEKTFPTHDCAFCLLESKLLKVAVNKNIEFISNSELVGVEGKVGDFKVKVSKLKRWIDLTKCNDCGECVDGCQFIFRYYAPLATMLSSKKDALGAVQRIYYVDRDRCDGCGDCDKICKEGALIHNENPEERTIEAQAIILSTGSQPFDPSGLKEFGYGDLPNVISNIDLERMMCEPGAHSSLVTRPSDGEVPKKVAFLQCIGSRDERTNTYCSSMCCMVALKEAIILVERYKVIEPTIFYMDIRAFGKEHDDYYNIARDEYKVNFVNSRASGIEKGPDGKVIVKYADKDGKASSEEFDMAVLSLGSMPPMGVENLAKATGVELNVHNFLRTSRFNPLSSSVEGIFGCGALTAPKDISDAVSEGAGAAMLAIIAAGDKDPKPGEKRTFGMEDVKPKVGVFVCSCGDKVNSVVDVPGLAEFVKGLPNVVHVEEGADYCSTNGQAAISKAFGEKGINRVVLAGCTPRLIDPVIMNTLMEEGMNPFLFEVANIREQVAWVHSDDKDMANDKAKAYVRMAVAKVNEDVPLPILDLNIDRSCLVIGGGLCGMTAALALEKRGFDVQIVEKEERLGGHLHHIKHLFEDEDDPQENLTRLVKEVEASDKITVHLGTTLIGMDGLPGMFTSKVKGPEGEKGIGHGAAILATGGIEYEPTEFLFGKNDKVVTQSGLEGLISEGRIDKDFGTVVMVQCVGSRTEEFPNCSRICCGVAVKNALKLKETAPGVEIFVLFKDMRTYGFVEDRYREARNKGVHFIQYSDENMPDIKEAGGKLRVELDDIILGKRIAIGADLVVLSTGIRPNPDNEDLAKKLKVPVSKDLFFLESHAKMRPVDLSTEGIFVCGLAHGPRNVSESIGQALAAAAHAAKLLSKPQLTGEVIIAEVDEDKCRGCARCEEQCEYAAIRVVTETIGDVERMVSKVDPAKCLGCGRCSVTCCNKAITMRNFRTGQIQRVIEAALEG